MLVLCSCGRIGFDATGQNDAKVGPTVDGAVDDAPSRDAPIAAACQDWGQAPRHFDPCIISTPSAGVSLGPGDWRYNTTTGEWTTPVGDPAPTTVGELVTQAGANPAHLLSVESFVVESGATLRVVGDAALIIASWSEIRIIGTISSESLRGEPGAGANPETCAAAEPGGSTAFCGGGGGGGGLSGLGGPGGDGESTANLGGAGGQGLALPDALVGGCPGATSGSGSIGGVRADPGEGGGALALAASSRVTIDGGQINVGGGGGAGGSACSGGGGGGSGGILVLDAPTVSAINGAILAANGGGGGSGDDVLGVPGSAGQMGDTPALGGAGGNTGVGGRGGAALVPAGGEGITTGGLEGGGGGGGGGVGYVAIHGQSYSQSDSTVSPPAGLRSP